MNNDIYSLKPERLWYFFGEILKVPRPSKKEEKIAAYIINFGVKNGLETIKDDIGNIIIRKPAASGFENRETVVLQSHIDMVCEKNNDVDHDFENDPIEAYIEDGWVKAKGTTLGADDGIGIAAQLAILEADDIEHGPIECLFTIDEETGLTGAFGLDPKVLKGSILLNLDSEDEGELFIGCAGGIDTVAELPYSLEQTPAGHAAFHLRVSGLLGGHSGDDIEKGRGNANKILNRFLWESADSFGLRLRVFDGGNLRNAIAREAYAVICVPESNADAFIASAEIFRNAVRNEFKVTEPNLELSTEPAELPSLVLSQRSQDKLLNAVYACPHGVMAWSQDIPNFVETSTNLASVKFDEENIIITTSQRSSVESAKNDIKNMVASVFRLIGAKVEHSDGYPGWSPDPHSKIVEITAALYKKLFNEEPIVRAVHARSGVRTHRR